MIKKIIAVNRSLVLIFWFSLTFSPCELLAPSFCVYTAFTLIRQFELDRSIAEKFLVPRGYKLPPRDVEKCGRESGDPYSISKSEMILFAAALGITAGISIYLAAPTRVSKKVALRMCAVYVYAVAIVCSLGILLAQSLITVLLPNFHGLLKKARSTWSRVLSLGFLLLSHRLAAKGGIRLVAFVYSVIAGTRVGLTFIRGTNILGNGELDIAAGAYLERHITLLVLLVYFRLPFCISRRRGSSRKATKACIFDRGESILKSQEYIMLTSQTNYVINL